MRPAPFRYFAPRSVDEALSLLSEHGDDARVLAGGQSLIPLMSLRMGRPEILIDLNRCDGLATIEQRDSQIVFGAMVRQVDAQKSLLTNRFCPLVSKAIMNAGPIAVRNRGTVGGTLAHADRSAELPGAAVVLEATMVIASAGGDREVTAENFFLGDLTTAVEPGEMLRAVRIPQSAPGAFSFFHEIGLRQEGVAIAGLAAELEFDGVVVRRARLAIIGVESTPLRLRPVEAALAGRQVNDRVIDELAEAARASVDPVDDAHATSAYRRHVVGALLKKALVHARAGANDVG